MTRIDVINRLVGQGLSFSTAIDVADGKLEEEFEVSQVRMARRAERWGANKEECPANLVAAWDLAPERFYLAYDGAYPGDRDSNEFVVINADVDEINSKLTYASGREEHPWHEDYRSKSTQIAYRWAHNESVTPPLISEFQGKIHLSGGMHRYHLARHLGAERMPFLVLRSELSKLQALLNTLEMGPAPG